LASEEGEQFVDQEIASLVERGGHVSLNGEGTARVKRREGFATESTSR
jgi:hypothetical protein